MNGAAEKLFKKYIDKKPFLQTIDRDGFTHNIWEVWKEKDIKKFQEIVENHEFIIADGHHRYITSLNHSRHGGCKYIMSLFIDFNDPGLIIYTSHRQIHKYFVRTIDELKETLNKKKIALSPWCETTECEDLIKDQTGGAKILNIPFKQPKKIEKCVWCKKEGKKVAYIGKTY